MTEFTLKGALFLLIANLIMLAIVPYGAAEWFISLFAALLMLSLVISIRVIITIREKRK